MPAPKALTAAEEAKLRLADRSVIVGALTSIRKPAGHSWLSGAHPHPDGQLPLDKPAIQALPAAEVIESIAARGPLHCIDGWSYLARALSSFAAGAHHACRHLAYYAELRAALSILASVGIGNFNYINIVASSSGQILIANNRPTHEFAWVPLDFWSKEPGSFEVISKAIDLAGAPLHDSLTAYFPSPSGRVLGSGLIARWGIDLSLAYLDRDERNQSSYQLNQLNPIHAALGVERPLFSEFWSAFEPGAWTIERHLLRELLEAEASAQSGTSNLASYSQYYGRLDPRVQSVTSRSFLERTSDPNNHPVLAHASDNTLPATPKAMLARAALLLKIATSIAEANLRSATLTPLVDLEFWWHPYGEVKGFWPVQNPPADLADLWLDVQDALSDASSTPSSDRFGWLSVTPSGIPRLAEAERIGLWALCR